MLVTQEDHTQETSVDKVMSIREVQEVFNIKDRKTVIMAIYTGRLVGRKMDTGPGELGGNWIVDRDNAFQLWGDRK